MQQLTAAKQASSFEQTYKLLSFPPVLQIDKQQLHTTTALNQALFPCNILICKALLIFLKFTQQDNQK
ncbi:hypothetical protein ABF86_04515 [Nitrosomonas sp. GH22]|nr:hypothetical protein [Nitrosomonas sp. GH22]